MSFDVLKGLKPEDYQHQGEAVAMKFLKAIPLMDVIMAKYIAAAVKLDAYPKVFGNNYMVTEKTNPRLYRLYKTALKRLDIDKEYPIFVTRAFEYNACAFGGSEPFFVINSSFVENCSDGELLFVLGHEIGHIKSGHTVYFNVARQLNMILGSLHQLGQAASIGVEYAIKEWGRNAEYTADRAGLIAAGGDMESVCSNIMKMLGKSEKCCIDIDFTVEKVLNQVNNFTVDTSDIIGKMLYLNATIENSHPWTILRLKQIYEWYNSGEFKKLEEKYS